MRYHWGLGVGHCHAHQPSWTYTTPQLEDPKDDQSSHVEPESSISTSVGVQAGECDHDSDIAELSLEDGHLAEEGWQDDDFGSSDDAGGPESGDSEDEDENFTGI